MKQNYEIKNDRIKEAFLKLKKKSPEKLKKSPKTFMGNVMTFENHGSLHMDLRFLVNLITS